MSVIKITKDIERVKSILDMVELIERRIKKDNKNEFFPLIFSDYYEMIKELITALLICDGFRTFSHIELVDYLKKNYGEFNEREIFILDNLRILRNRVVYEGFKIPMNYLSDNEFSFLAIIKKLKSLVITKLTEFIK